MRGFFLLLLLTNVAFLLWQYKYPGSTAQADIYSGIQFENQGLTLLSELPAGERPAQRQDVALSSGRADMQTAPREPRESERVAPPVAGDERPQQERICRRVGGIEERTLLDKLLAELKVLGVTRLLQGSEQGQKSNYWVMLPPYSNRDKATEAAEILKDKKVKDFFIVRSGDYENAVSLGVFSTRERAQRRYDQIAALNARLRRPRIESIELPAKRYWLSFELSDSARMSELEPLLQKHEVGQGEEIRCE
jgi:hypothetical protein